jgi:hypothetical protein
MADVHELFNRKLVEFVDDLIVTFPQFADFVGYRTLLMGAIALDKTSPRQIFNQTVAIPYEKYILEKNEVFLLQETYATTTKQGLVDQLKQVWRTMDDSNKESIWKYMQVLVILNRKCGF